MRVFVKPALGIVLVALMLVAMASAALVLRGSTTAVPDIIHSSRLTTSNLISPPGANANAANSGNTDVPCPGTDPCGP